MMFPIIELVDRYCIAKVKQSMTGNANAEEIEFYTVQLAHYDVSKISTELQQLIDIHKTIWNLESDLKSGTEENLPLEEIGRRAIEIRNWNNKRISLKNIMSEKLGCSVREIKRNHASE